MSFSIIKKNMLPSVEGFMVDDHTVSCRVIFFSSCSNLPYHPPLRVECLIVLCYWFVCLRLVYPMLPVSLDCQFLIAPSVFSNVYNFFFFTKLYKKQIKINKHNWGSNEPVINPHGFSNWPLHSIENVRKYVKKDKIQISADSSSKSTYFCHLRKFLIW